MGRFEDQTGVCQFFHFLFVIAGMAFATGKSMCVVQLHIVTLNTTPATTVFIIAAAAGSQQQKRQ
jgi:hypothetical protein